MKKTSYNFSKTENQLNLFHWITTTQHDSNYVHESVHSVGCWDTVLMWTILLNPGTCCQLRGHSIDTLDTKHGAGAWWTYI